jgi:hypothetical protein
MAEQPDGGLNFFIRWEFLEYAVTVISGALIGGAAWVWRLGVRISKIESIVGVDLPVNLADRVNKLEIVMGLSDKRSDERHLDNIRRIDELGQQIAAVRAELPTRDFVEAKMTDAVRQITEAIDRGVPRN